ncbi:hypothetical protein CYMTET_30269 [Cymbomonas tetramitiformis]|uniref:Uncharacterized protein n=1 Tax=Cymbomonas tetramitiformis TaxID=36881 RepID=A0AAE0FJV3_9CHLO|nr:hypothetical protein CYMTET_30269 [Cymbomonas tetramitiformis]
MVRPVESAALGTTCGVGTCCAKHSRVLAFDKWVDKITRCAISEKVSEAQELDEVPEEEATHVEMPQPELEIELEHEELQDVEAEVAHKMQQKESEVRYQRACLNSKASVVCLKLLHSFERPVVGDNRAECFNKLALKILLPPAKYPGYDRSLGDVEAWRKRLPISDSPRFKALCGELESVLHAETCKRIERRDKKDDRDEEEGAAPKVGWNLGWWFNMGRTAQQWGFAKKKDGTSAFSLKHPFFKNRGVYLDDPLVSKSNPYWKKEIFMLAGELLKCIDANYHGVHGDWCLYVSCMMSDMCEVGRHTDKHDVSHQYNIFLGRFENAVYEVESPYNDEVKCFFDTHKVFKSDARCKHRINSAGFIGVRYCVTFYKMYDRTQKKEDPIFWPPTYI